MIFAPEDVQSRLSEQPFRPLRIVASSGQSYDVRHPDMVWVGERFLVIGIPSQKNPTWVDQVARVALAHVTDLQDLEIHV
jgi:hypothetical protein